MCLSFPLGPALFMALFMLLAGCETPPVDGPQLDDVDEIEVEALTPEAIVPFEPAPIEPEPSAELPQSSLRFGRVLIQGGFERQFVDRTLRRHQASLRACLERRDHPGSGTLDVRWIVLLSGATGVVQIKSHATGDQAVERCMERVIASWKLAKPRSCGPTILSFSISYVYAPAPAE